MPQEIICGKCDKHFDPEVEPRIQLYGYRTATDGTKLKLVTDVCVECDPKVLQDGWKHKPNWKQGKK